MSSLQPFLNLVAPCNTLITQQGSPQYNKPPIVYCHHLNITRLSGVATMSEAPQICIKPQITAVQMFQENSATFRKRKKNVA